MTPFLLPDMVAPPALAQNVGGGYSMTTRYATAWYILAEQEWYILGEDPWYIMGEHHWYIIARTVTLDPHFWTVFGSC